MDGSRQLGRYEVLERIGSGGMAVVHLARQLDLDRLVALKELSQFHAEDPTWASRFLRESRLAGSLTHANIVTVYDYFQVDGTPYIAMEYLERGSLRPYMSELGLAQIGGVLRDVLAGLQHAERRSIVHRDLKPENLLVTGEGTVKIADFGIAKATSHLSLASFNTEAGVAVGTPGYMAPEQAMARELGTWSDLYALGCMAYEMSVGRLPFSDTSEPFALMLRHISEPVPSAHTVDPDVPRELSDWIDSLLVKETADRVGSATEAWESLDEILFRLLGPRWQRESALPGAVTSTAAPAPHLTSAFFDPAELAEHLPEATAAGVLAPTAPDEPSQPPEPPAIPDALPGPYTPPPGEAVVSAELAALDPSPPETYVTVDVAAFSPPTPASDSVVVTPPPNFPAAAPAPAAETPPSPPASAGEDFVTFEPWPERAAPAPPTEERVTPPAPVTPPTAPLAAPPADPARRGRRVLLVVSGVLATAAAIGATIVLNGGGDVPPPSNPAASQAVDLPKDSSLSAGPLTITVPAGWSAGTGGPKGLTLESAVRTTPPDGKSGAIILGVAPAGSTNHTLIPEALVKRSGGSATRTEAVLGEVHAYHYEDLPGGLTVYVAPTDQGVATIACEPPVTDTCGSLASTLKVDGAKVLALGPDDTFKGVVTKALTDLDRATATGASALRAAKTPRGQANAAATAQGRYAKVGATLRKTHVSPADAAATRALTAAVRASATGYERLANAARANDRGRYNIAASAIRTSRKQIGSALGLLELAGYTGLRTPRASDIPPLVHVKAKSTPTPSHSRVNPSYPQATPTPRPTNVPHYQPTPQPTVKPKPTPIPSKPTPVPIDSGDG